MLASDLVAYHDRNRDLYALYQDKDLCAYGSLGEIAVAVCATNETPFSFLDVFDAPLKAGGTYPETLPDKQSVFAFAYGFLEEEAAVYESGLLVMVGNVEVVARYFLSVVGAEIKEGNFFQANGTAPVVRLEELGRDNHNTQDIDANEAFTDVLVAMMPYSGVNLTTRRWGFDVPALAELPTDTIIGLQKRLMEKGLDNITASCAILNVCQDNFPAATIKFFFDNARLPTNPATSRGGARLSARGFRMLLSERGDFDESLLAGGDIAKDDAAAMLIRLLRNPRVSHATKAAIWQLEYERKRPRKSVVEAHEVAIANPIDFVL